jgi:hypothetical protein
MTCYDPESLIEHIRSMRRYFGSIEVQLKEITIDWRSWRLLAQHVNREVYKQPRYTNMTQLIVDGVEVKSDKGMSPHPEQTAWDCPSLQLEQE